MVVELYPLLPGHSSLVSTAAHVCQDMITSNTSSACRSGELCEFSLVPQVPKPQYHEKTQTLIYSKGCALDALQRISTKDAAGSSLLWLHNNHDALGAPPPAVQMPQSRPPIWIENDRKVCAPDCPLQC